MSNYIAPVTSQEILERYSVKLVDKQSTGFVKVIEFADTNSGDKFVARLWWDVHDGYSFGMDSLNGVVSMKDLMTRPEFEYELDSLTERDEKLALEKARAFPGYRPHGAHDAG